MIHDRFEQFLVLCFIGFGLLLASAVNLFLRKSGIARRALATTAVVGCTGLASWLFAGQERVIAPVAVSLSGVLTPTLFLGTRRGSTATALLCERLRRPEAPWWFCAAGGIGAIVCSSVLFDARDAKEVDTATDELDRLEDIGEREFPFYFHPAAKKATTDRGNPVTMLITLNPRPAEEHDRIEAALFQHKWNLAQLIRRGPGDDRTNCLGWLFAGGEYWLLDREIDRIIRDNGYQIITQPRPDDLVVYRQNGHFAHVAIVRVTTKDLPAIVEGKWGFNGVYLHPVDASIYGSNYVYYRSPRSGHLLAGLDAPTRPSPQPPVAAENETE
jgi:hypothetical protein